MEINYNRQGRTQEEKWKRERNTEQENIDREINMKVVPYTILISCAFGMAWFFNQKGNVKKKKKNCSHQPLAFLSALDQ